jgi:hypothetical protein
MSLPTFYRPYLYASKSQIDLALQAILKNCPITKYHFDNEFEIANPFSYLIFKDKESFEKGTKDFELRTQTGLIAYIKGESVVIDKNRYGASNQTFPLLVLDYPNFFY